jgi:type I restriction enzyme S subunit
MKEGCEVEIDPKYLIYYFRSSVFRKRVTSMASLTTRASLNNSMIDRLPILLPEIDTQKKIGQFLFTIDQKIEANETVNKKLEEQMWAVYRNTFSGSRFAQMTLGEVTKRITERIGEREATVLSAVFTGNLQPSDEHFNKRVYSKDISKYIVVDEGNFAYNPARINIGSIGINDLGYLGCVSPVYVVFKTDERYRAFFRFYFRTSQFKEECKTRAYGSVRQSLNYNDFSNIVVGYPDQATAESFDKKWSFISGVINANRRESASLERMKRALFEDFISERLDADLL